MKLLSFLIGPPNVPPYWLRLKGETEAAKKLRASIASLRRNSNAEPWNWFPPERVENCTVAPAPDSLALKLEDLMVNSSSVSGLGSTGAVFKWRSTKLTPSNS